MAATALEQTMWEHQWRPRSPERMPDAAWRATLLRVRREFEEMPCMRVTPASARALFGVPERMSLPVLERLVTEGFLSRTTQGAYMRRTDTP